MLKQVVNIATKFFKTVFPTLFSSQTPFWLPKITTDPHIPAGVNTDCPDDRYPKFIPMSQN